jgi:hypothetical protein
MYQAKIEFQYTVGGKSFVSPSTSSSGTTDYGAMKRVADDYAPGTRHTIRYDPAYPNDIRFDAGYNVGFFLVPIVTGGIGIVLFGMGVGLRSCRDRSNRCVVLAVVKGLRAARISAPIALSPCK